LALATQTLVRIAVVDELPVLRAGLPGWLATVDPDIHVAHSASGVDELLRDGRPDVHAVVLDPDIDGAVPGADVVRLVGANLRVVVFSQLFAGQTMREALLAGASGYVLKTAQASELALAIRAVANGEVWMSRVFAQGMADVGGPVESLLSGREREVVRSYANGLKLQSIAYRLGVSANTAKEYLDRAKHKYRLAGRTANTKLDLYQRAVEDGLIDNGNREALAS
jgi:DNA-binding NarL/FixJ family response regulator